MKKIIVSMIVAGLISITFVASVGVSKSASTVPSVTIYVDDDNIEGPWDGTIEHPFQTIQDGINAATNGDAVYIFNGAYVTARIDKSVNLIGEDKESTIVNGEIIVLTNWVNVSGFTIHNPGGWCGVHLEDRNFCNISNNILNSGSYGVFRSQNSIISKNIILNTGIGIFPDENNIIKENIIKNNSVGIELTFENNLVYENNISFNRACGLFIASDGNDITRNNIYSNGWENSYSNPGYGAVVTHGKGNTISSNNFIKNKVNAEIYVALFQKNTWNKNYWDDFRGLGLKRIRGTLFIVFFEYSEFERLIELPWVNFDWHPAREPYDLPNI